MFDSSSKIDGRQTYHGVLSNERQSIRLSMAAVKGDVWPPQRDGLEDSFYPVALIEL